MTDITKARWSANGDELRMGIEFTKVNKQRRLVSGWATLDNVDVENDVVTAEASLDAFKRARGNIREMHKKDKAVGRLVNFEQRDFRAPDGNVHKGIFVTARISKGAWDTWEKVLDGTLSGFSIGGHIIDEVEEFNKTAGAPIRKVTKYDLTELSLVDNPGNQYANVFSIKKSADGSVSSISGMIEEFNIFNIFYCDDDEISIESDEDSQSCPACGELMTNIGFVEDGGSHEQEVAELVTKYLDPKTGGETMSKFISNDLEKSSGAEAPEAIEDNDLEKSSEAEVEEVETIEEVHDVESDLTKRIDAIKDSIEVILNNSTVETSDKIDALEKNIQDTRDFFDKRISEFDDKFKQLDTSLETTKSRLAEFEKSLGKINASGAFRKSADLDDSADNISHNDPWSGSAFSVHGITKGL